MRWTPLKCLHNQYTCRLTITSISGMVLFFGVTPVVVKFVYSIERTNEGNFLIDDSRSWIQTYIQKVVFRNNSQ